MKGSKECIQQADVHQKKVVTGIKRSNVMTGVTLMSNDIRTNRRVSHEVAYASNEVPAPQVPRKLGDSF